MARNLYIIAYDIREPKRLSKVHYFLKNFSTGGQKSVYECFLTYTELLEVIRNLYKIIDMNDDRVHIFPLDGRSKTHTLGIAVQPRDPKFYYLG